MGIPALESFLRDNETEILKRQRELRDLEDQHRGAETIAHIAALETYFRNKKLADEHKATLETVRQGYNPQNNGDQLLKDITPEQYAASFFGDAPTPVKAAAPAKPASAWMGGGLNPLNYLPSASAQVSPMPSAQKSDDFRHDPIFQGLMQAIWEGERRDFGIVSVNVEYPLANVADFAARQMQQFGADSTERLNYSQVNTNALEFHQNFIKKESFQARAMLPLLQYAKASEFNKNNLNGACDIGLEKATLPLSLIAASPIPSLLVVPTNNVNKREKVDLSVSVAKIEAAVQKAVTAQTDVNPEEAAASIWEHLQACKRSLDGFSRVLDVNAQKDKNYQQAYQRYYLARIHVYQYEAFKAGVTTDVIARRTHHLVNLADYAMQRMKRGTFDSIFSYCFFWKSNHDKAHKIQAADDAFDELTKLNPDLRNNIPAHSRSAANNGELARRISDAIAAVNEEPRAEQSRERRLSA